VSVAVRRLGPADYDALRELRLESLRRHPGFFAADPQQEAAMPKEEWLRRLASAVSFGGFVEGKLSGLLVFSRSTRPKLAHTGDLGAMDSRGYLKITGRVKEMIIRGGENLFPAEIENAMLEHGQILEVAVVGIPDEKWGE